MSKFEFIMMFVSVVVAFAMAELLMGWGKIVRARHRASRPGLLIGWSVWLLIIMTYHYLGFWEYQAYDFTRVMPMMVFLAAPIMMVLLTFVLTPDIHRFQKIDLETHFFQIKNWFFFMIMVFLLLARASDLLLPDYSETWIQRLAGTVFVLISTVWLIFTDNRRIHYAMMVFNLLYVSVVSTLLPIRGLTAF